MTTFNASDLIFVTLNLQVTSTTHLNIFNRQPCSFFKTYPEYNMISTLFKGLGSSVTRGKKHHDTRRFLNIVDTQFK